MPHKKGTVNCKNKFMWRKEAVGLLVEFLPQQMAQQHDPWTEKSMVHVNVIMEFQ